MGGYGGDKGGVQFCWMQFCNGHGIAALHFCASALLRTVVRCTILRCRAVRCTFERCRAFRDALFSWGGSPVQLQTAFPDHQHQIWKMVIAHRAEDVSLVVSVRSVVLSYWILVAKSYSTSTHTACFGWDIYSYIEPDRPDRPDRHFISISIDAFNHWFYVTTP